MKTGSFLGALCALLALPGCQTSRTPYSPVRDASYSAIGENPFWMVAIGDDRIVLTLGPGPGEAPRDLQSNVYPRVLPRTVDGVKRWESGEGTAVISIEARPGPCTAGGRDFEDRVTVALSGRMMQGCGGREIKKARG